MRIPALKPVLAAAFLALSAAVSVPSVADASTVQACNLGAPDATPRVTDGASGMFMCEFATGLTAPNPTGAYNDAFFGGGFTEIERDGTGTNTTGSLTGGGGTKSGSFSISASLLGTYDSFVLVFKSANDGNTAPSSAVAYLLGTQLTGDYLTPFARTTGNGCNGTPTFTGCERDVSHIALLGKIDPVPLPAAGWLMIGGFASLLVLRRRCKPV